jgi:hypothetical protein
MLTTSILCLWSAQIWKTTDVRPSLTAEPYAIANNLPYRLVSDFQLNDVSTVTQNTINFFFNDPHFSNHKILLATYRP